MKTKDIVEYWTKKQQDNADIYKKVLAEQKEILSELKSMSLS